MEILRTVELCQERNIIIVSRYFKKFDICAPQTYRMNVTGCTALTNDGVTPSMSRWENVFQTPAGKNRNGENEFLIAQFVSRIYNIAYIFTNWPFAVAARCRKTIAVESFMVQSNWFEFEIRKLEEKNIL